MGIEIVRIDDRLIHGQVIIGWTRSKGIEEVVAVDDKVAKDKFQSQLMKMAVPPGVKSQILTVDDAIAKIGDGSGIKRKTMVVVKGPEALLRLVNSGLSLSNVNVGIMRSGPNKKQLSNQVFATEEEISAMKELDAKGISLTAQSLPGTPSVNLNSVLKGV